MRETSMRGQVLAMSVDHSGESASSAPNAAKTKEGEVEDEQSRQNLASAAKSAFEITSVTTAADDELETSIRHPMSADAENMIKSGAFKTKSSGESQGNLSLSEDQTVEGAAGDKSKALVGETIENFINISDADMKPAPGGLASNSQTQIQGAVGVNGPNVQLGPSRFKRVSNYNRGRWVVRDTSEPEERPESSELLKGSHTIAENATFAAGSPPVAKKSTLTEHSETSQHSRSSSDVGPSPPVLTGALRELREGGGGDSSSEKDAHIDRSSTVGDTLSLSRNTSLSSIATVGEQKSIDGDEHPRDTDNDSVTSSVPGGTTPDMRESGTYPPTPSTTASGVAPPSTVTSSATVLSTQTQEQHGQNCTCDSCSSAGKKGQEKTVRTALDTLKTELEQLLDNKTQLENLKQQNDTLARDKEMLRRSKERLEKENSRLQKDFERLQQTVTQLQHDVAQLVQEKKHVNEELSSSQKKLQQQQMHLPNTSSTAPVSENFESQQDST